MPLLPVAESASPAVIALVGTVVGALIGALTNVAISRLGRRDEARASARLVESDLRVAADVVREWRRNLPERPSAASVEELQMAAWREFRGVLAYALDRASWTAVHDGCATAERVRREYERAGSSITDAYLTKAESTIETALTTLGDGGTWARVTARRGRSAS